MTQTLFAMLKKETEHEVRRVPVTAQLVGQLDQLFEHQEQIFTSSISENVKFDGMYKPDKEELLYIDDAALTDPLTSCVSANASSIPTLDINQLSNSRVQFLFRRSTVQSDRILLQRFSSRQHLSSSGLALILRSGTYEKLIDPGFTLDDKISAYIVND